MTFKVGNKVRIKRGEYAGSIGVIQNGYYNGTVLTVGILIYDQNTIADTRNYRYSELELVKESTMKPHMHAEVIKAWADGAKIQARPVGGISRWEDTGNPGWFKTFEYRVKPEPKPDIVHFFLAGMTGYTILQHIPNNSTNLKLTFDGETGDLKAAEVIKK